VVRPWALTFTEQNREPEKSQVISYRTEGIEGKDRPPKCASLLVFLVSCCYSLEWHGNMFSP
jgi:hypothetical protein